jgi:hypothetical protein
MKDTLSDTVPTALQTWHKRRSLTACSPSST